MPKSEDFGDGSSRQLLSESRPTLVDFLDQDRIYRGQNFFKMGILPYEELKFQACRAVDYCHSPAYQGQAFV